MTFQVAFEPVGRRGISSAGESVLEIAQRLGVDLVATCDGKGTCGQCKVQVLAGEMSLPTSIERKNLSEVELGKGYRLACQTYPQAALKVYVPPESLSAPVRAQIEGLEMSVSPDPSVLSYQLELPEPSLSDLTSDFERLRQALQAQHGTSCDTADIEVLYGLSSKLREWNWSAQVELRGSELVAIGPWPRRQLGLAFDLGTTKIAGYLVDLATGETLAAKGTMNPQTAYGDDLVTRLTRVRGAPDEAQLMQQLVIDALNSLAEEMCVEITASTDQIVEAVVVANSAMHHLFLRLPTEQLLAAPYITAVSDALDVKGRDLGLRIAPGAYVHMLPNIASYVGADHVAMLLATGMGQTQGLVLALDIGTNTEICLASDGKMVSVSTASGPAFEGAHIKHGMRAAPGAIEHIKLGNNQLEYETIGRVPPVGICGSGILDAVAQLLLAGVLNRAGTMGNHPRVREDVDGKEFVLVDEKDSEQGSSRTITITQRDVREVQLAKGAMRAGITALLHNLGREEEEIDQVIIAGAFGSYIDPMSAVAIGMLPPLPASRFKQVGNAAGTGAKLALISREQRALAEDIARRVHYIELASLPNFGKLFAGAMYLQQTTTG